MRLRIPSPAYVLEIVNMCVVAFVCLALMPAWIVFMLAVSAWDLVARGRKTSLEKADIR